MNLDDKEVDTIGALVPNQLGHVPKRGERVILGGHEIEVLSADGRRPCLVPTNIVLTR